MSIPNVILINVPVPIEHEITMSQIGRLFAIGNLVSTNGFEKSFFITSDIDLWPMSMKNYTLVSVTKT